MLLTPFYFLKAGLFVSIPAVLAAAGLIAVLLAVKMSTKIVGVWPLARAFNLSAREANYTTMLMSTGLTFGTISALYGLTHQIVTQAQYSVLVTVVIGSAVVPTLIAQTFFYPRERARAGAASAADLGSTASALTAAGEEGSQSRCRAVGHAVGRWTGDDSCELEFVEVLEG